MAQPLHNPLVLDVFQNDIDEAVELIELSHSLFQKKLSVLKAQSAVEKDPQKKKELHKNAGILFSEYKKSLQVIEEFIDHIYEKNKLR